MNLTRTDQVKIIDSHYAKLYLNSLKTSQSLSHPTSKGYFGFSDVQTIFELFKKIKLEKYNRFLDLGSGNGCVVAIASLFTKATGGC